MYQVEYDEFKQCLGDLCVAVNRPFNDDLARVFWEDLRLVPLERVKQHAQELRATGKTRFTSSDLKPVRGPANTYEPTSGDYDKFHRLGQLALFSWLKSNGAASEESLPKLIMAKNEILTAAKTDPKVDLKEVLQVLEAAFKRHWQPMTEQQTSWHLDHYQRTGRVFDPR